MKSLAKNTFLTAIICIAFFSCKKDKDDPKPVITITAQPQAANVNAGSITGNLSITASVTQSATLTYQWYSNASATVSTTGGTKIDGATAATFAIPATLTAANSPYYYFCELSAIGATSVRSTAATVTVVKLVPNIVLTITGTYSYNGAAQPPSHTVTADGALLAEVTDYVLTYGASGNKNAGTVTVTAEGRGTYAGKTDTKTFEIAKFQVLITANNVEKSFWDDDPAQLTYTCAPPLFAGDQFTGVLKREAGDAVGTYKIERNTLTPGDNYVYNFVDGVFEIKWFKGDGASTKTPYEIGRAEQLAKLAELVNAGDTDYNDKYYQLITDISLSEHGKFWNGGKGWIPIGKYNPPTNPFYGYFEGDNHEVSGLYINDSNLDYVGLFGSVVGGSIQNLGVIDVSITGKTAGGLVGSNHNGCSIINCYASGEVRGTNGVGGLAGFVYTDCNITNCYATCTVISSGFNTGGLAGSVNYSNITNCYATGMVSSGESYVGGLVGYFIMSTMTNCVALNPSVSGSNYVGRVAGINIGTLSNNIAFDGMSGATWSHRGLTDEDGDEVTTQQIKADGTLGGRFPNNGTPWTTENGKLPGLFGAAVALPDHLK